MIALICLLKSRNEVPGCTMYLFDVLQVEQYICNAIQLSLMVTGSTVTDASGVFPQNGQGFNS